MQSKGFTLRHYALPMALFLSWPLISTVYADNFLSPGAGALLPGALQQSSQQFYSQQKKGVDTLKTKELPKLETPTSTPLESKTPELQIKVTNIEVEGATKINKHLLNKLIQPYENRTTSLAELQSNVVSKITKWYIDKGYVTTAAFIPPQKLDGGVLLIKVDEGYVGEVSFVKKTYFGSRAVLPRIATRRGKIFNLNTLQNGLDRINEGQALQLEASLKPGQAPGTSDVAIKVVQENFPFEITPTFDNLGRPSIGRNRLGFNAINRNLFGFGDTAYISPSFYTHSYSVGTGYELPLGSHGTKIGFSQARSAFKFTQGPQAYNGQSNIYNIYTQQELYRKRDTNINLELGFAIKDSSFDFLGFPYSHDYIRVLTPALNFQRTDSTGKTFGRLEAGIGLDVLGATEGDDLRTSRFRAGSQFLRYNALLLRLQKLPWNTYGQFRFTGQYSPNSLVSLEQFQAGGYSTVRGYQEGRLIGDSGFAFNAEWHIPAWFLPNEAKFLKHTYSPRNSVELVSFLDVGAVFLNNLFSNSATSKGVNAKNLTPIANSWLASTGVGLRIHLGKYLIGRLDLAFPLIHNSPDRNWARLHFGIEGTLF